MATEGFVLFFSHTLVSSKSSSQPAVSRVLKYFSNKVVSLFEIWARVPPFKQQVRTCRRERRISCLAVLGFTVFSFVIPPFADTGFFRGNHILLPLVIPLLRAFPKETI